MPVSASSAGTDLIHLPSKTAVLAYAKSEVGLLWSSIIAAKSTTTFFSLTPNQKGVLLQLNTLLSQQSGGKILEEAFRTAIHSLYIPQTVIDLAEDPFKSPVAVFQALQLSTKAKTFIDIASMDQKLNPLQFMMQLRGSSHLLKTVVNDGDMHEVTNFCKRYLEEWKFSPFATSRLWMKELRAAAAKATPPPQIYWITNQSIQIGSSTIIIPEYLQFIKDELNSLWEFLRDTLMFNIPAEDFKKMCSPEHLGKATEHPSIGDNSLFMETSTFYREDPSSFFLNHDAINLVTHMARNECLGLNATISPVKILVPVSESHEVKWDYEQCHEWLSKVHLAWERAYCLYHTTSGLPARVTEEVTLRMTHSPLGPSNLLTINGKLQTRSDYNKTSTTSGLSKHITRVLHPHLAHIFLVLLRCIRPLELQILKGVGAADDSTALLYTTMLFVSWGQVWDSKGAAEVFAAWFSQGLHLERAGVSFYRQFATALQRKWLSEMDHSTRAEYDKAVQNDEGTQFEAVSAWWQANLQLN